MSRFSQHVPGELPAGACWPWQGSRNTYGYGRISEGKRGSCVALMAHRLSWEIHRGAIPDGMNVLHSCDNPPCVNPGHLFLGSQADNVADMVAKGRQQRGAKHAHSKLTDAEAVVMRTAYLAGTTTAELAARFGRTKTGVTYVLRGEGWRHLDDGLQAQLDVMLRSRLSRPGESHPSSKLTEADVREIRQLLGSLRHADIAQRFGISTALVSMINTRKAWAHLPDEE